jgi:predicted oxidoreductase
VSNDVVPATYIGATKVSELIGGCWHLSSRTGGDPKRIGQYINDCLENGISAFDHADIYGDQRTESLFGAAMRLHGIARERVQLISKCGIARPSAANRVLHLNASGAYLETAVNRSLASFQTDYLDVFLLHRPDPLMEPEGLAAAMVQLKSAGKVREFGVSNFSVNTVELLQKYLPFPLATNQIQVSLVHTMAIADGTLEWHFGRNLRVMASCPLGSGRVVAPARTRLARSLHELARTRGEDAGTIALAWLLRLPARPIPVLGAVTSAHLQAAARAFRVQLDRQDWFALYAAAGGVFA